MCLIPLSLVHTENKRLDYSTAFDESFLINYDLQFNIFLLLPNLSETFFMGGWNELVLK